MVVEQFLLQTAYVVCCFNYLTGAAKNGAVSAVESQILV